MSGPGLRTYLWFDDKGKKTRVPAPQYIDYVMTFIQKTVSDETIFPTKYGKYEDAEPRFVTFIAIGFPQVNVKVQVKC